MRGTYSFKTIEENEFDLEGYPFTVKISRVDNNIARLTLIDQNKEQIDVPNNIRLRNLDDNVVSAPIVQSFFITWIGSYSLFDGETELVRMTNQKQHSISGPKINDNRTYVDGILKPKKRRRILIVGDVEAEEDAE
jgi:hypothetical protein